MGVRRNIVPWLCYFLHSHLQWVRLNTMLSDDVQLTTGVRQGTKFGPMGFQMFLLLMRNLNTGNMLIILTLQKT